MTSPNDSDKRGCGDREEGRLRSLALESIPPLSVTRTVQVVEFQAEFQLAT